MSTPKFRADYEALERIALIFGREALNVRQTSQGLHRQLDVLMNGNWEGDAARKFQQEMLGGVLPAVKSLAAALTEAGQTTRKISQLIKLAEETAAALFKAPDPLGEKLDLSGYQLPDLSPSPPAAQTGDGQGAGSNGNLGAGPVKNDAQARAEARQVLDYIRSEAQVAAGSSDSITRTRFYQRLTEFYLKEYLAAPGPQTGEAAIAQISKQLSGYTDPNNPDFWEQCSLDHFNKTPIPEPARIALSLALGAEIPAEVSAATDILSVGNRQALPNIDVDQLLGKDNLSKPEIEGGRNVTQLMHWATGVKYSNLDPQAARGLFIAYELWHQEAWDVFGEDPLNDLIAEEAGRLLAIQLQAGAVTAENLPEKLNEAFAESRAWVGSLLRLRTEQIDPNGLNALDKWILSEKPDEANWSNTWMPTHENVWGGDTVFTLLKSGQDVEGVKKSEHVQRLKEIYGLIHEAETWEATHGSFNNSQFIQDLARGKYDALITQIQPPRN